MSSDAFSHIGNIPPEVGWPVGVALWIIVAGIFLRDRAVARRKARK